MSIASNSGGGLDTDPGGGMVSGFSDSPYYSNIPPWHIFIKYLEDHGMKEDAALIKSYMP
jgi:hypothetical protein